MGKIEDLAGLRIESLEITNFLGIKHQKITFGPSGIAVVGANGEGKTSIERAIEATVEGFGADCIHSGEAAAELILNADKLRIRRRVPQSGKGTVIVTEDEGRTKWTRVQEQLDLLFGKSIDPLAFLNADKKTQRKLVLDACPVGEVTAEDVSRWIDDRHGVIRANYDLPDIEGKNGLEAVGTLHKAFYDARTAANAAAKKAGDVVDEARKKLQSVALPEGAGKGILVPMAGQEDIPVADARAARASLDQRKAQAEAQELRATGTREKIAALIAEAENLQANGPKVPPLREVQAALEKSHKAASLVESLETQLAAAKAALSAAEAEVIELQDIQKKANEATAEEARKRQQARELAESLEAVAIAAPASDEIAKADQAIADAEKRANLIKALRAEQIANVDLAHAMDLAAIAKGEAAALDTAVNNLANIAPKELIERSNGIPGLGITDDGITLDGKAFDNLCGAEKMFFAVDLAKRARKGKVKVLPVDELEKLDEHNRVEFLKMATADGWMVVGTLVAGCPLTVISLDEAKDVPDAITPTLAMEKRIAELEGR